MVAVKNFMHQTIKKKNIVTPEMCLCIMDLVEEEALLEKVNNIIHSVGKSLGITVTDNISGRSAQRIVGQAKIAMQLQAVNLITCSNGANSSTSTLSDGTSHKGLNYESRHAHFLDPDTNEKMMLFLGISLAPGHTSEEQLEGWVHTIDGLYVTYMASPVAASSLSAWDALSDADRAVCSSEITKAVILQIGKVNFNKLTPGQQAKVDFCVWCGCAMHKDLNAHKGRTAKAITYWEVNHKMPPCSLPNKDNEAILGMMSRRPRLQR
ncbi:hypothetical protein EV368DRAFT_65047 [Lentinula lateritia]|nr:hypothetical protein EV368DRAFT_65047 [Lentinula lateritia]